MPLDLFSLAGITAWQQRLNHSARFAEAARSWQGRLVLIEQEPSGLTRNAWVVVTHGKCTEARLALPSDELTADYVLSAAADTWSDLTAARITPAMAAMTGRLHLLKGNVMSLIPHAQAAAELLATAAEAS